MSRIPMVTGNWKMNLLRAEALDLARAVRERCSPIAGVETVICPPYVFLHDVRAIVDGSPVGLGAQDAYPEEKGAFTGEVSIAQVAEVAQYIILGHSERRQYFGETDESVNRRVRAALAYRVKPIMCVGETRDERNAGRTEEVLVRQTRGGLDGIEIGPEFVVAYEPVWAIGTGLAANGATAQQAIALIRATLREHAPDAAGSVRILYGGSVTPENIGEYMAESDIDGGLVGGASLKADSFVRLVEAVAASGA